jgi:cytidyltransferase-like protein
MCAVLCVILKNNIEKMKPKAIIVSGYFNPIHKGHIEYFQNAKANGDKLFVIVNSDFQRALKGSKEFQNENERVFIVESLRLVDKCFLSIDNDRTVIESIKMIFDQFGDEYQLAFANGGDQNNDTIPERSICEELGIELIDGLGAKIQSSSWLLNKQ